jgi:hypothetical protein
LAFCPCLALWPSKALWPSTALWPFTALWPLYCPLSSLFRDITDTALVMSQTALVL